MKLCSLLLLIASPSVFAAPVPKFESQTIDPGISIGYGLAIGDVDGDKKPDILLADAKEIVCYKNPEWKKTVIARGLSLRDNVCLAAEDLNGDGKVEIAAGANWNPGETSDLVQSGSVHYLVRPETEGELWKPVPLPHEPTVHRMRWARCGANRWALVVLPLHGRGNKNGDGENGVQILAYLMPPDPTDPKGWQTVLIDKSLHVTHNFDQRSGAQTDVLLIGGKEAFLRVTPDAGGQRWVVERLSLREGSPAPTVAFPGTGEVRFFGGSDADCHLLASIEPFHGSHLCCYDWDAESKVWVRQVIESSFNQGHALACGKLLGGEDWQIVAGWREPNAEKKVGVKIYWRNSDKSWGQAVVDDNKMACEDLKLADLNGDGKPDIIAAGRATKNVVVYWNKSGS